MKPKLGIADGLRPRSVHGRTEHLASEEGFREGLNRDAGTDARIGIFKNAFAGRPIRRKGFVNGEIEVGWAVVTHKRWMVGRVAREESKGGEKRAKQIVPKEAAAPPRLTDRSPTDAIDRMAREKPVWD